MAMPVGCGRDVDDVDKSPDLNDETSSDYVFTAEFTSLSALADDLPNMSNVLIANNTVYFTSTNDIKNDNLFHTTRIFSLDLDDLVLTSLPNYTAAAPPTGAQGGGVHISAILVDADGYLWVSETGSFVEFNFPPNFVLSEAKADEIWEYLSSNELSYRIRKLDSTGAELRSFDIGYLSATPDWVGFFSFHVDDSGNIFIGFGYSIYVLNANGETLFDLSTESMIFSGNLLRLSDGRTAFFNGGSAITGWMLRVVNIQNRAWGENITLPVNTHNAFSGVDEYLAFINDSTNLSGIHIDTGEILPIINWADSIGVPVGLGNVTFLPDGRVMFTTTTYVYDDDGNSKPRTELITLNRTSRDELPEKITLTMAATFLPPEIVSAVAEFNRTNAYYQIEVNMLELGFHTITDDLGKLALEIITGSGPDIIETSALPFYQWAARGLFVDLYELIDADPTFNRTDILDVVLRNAETNGKLYQILPGFNIKSMVGNADVLGNEPGWTFGELIKVLEANPQATNAFGVWTDGFSLFREIFLNHVDSFINWETGTVDFDNDYFVEFLEFANELRRSFNWFSENRDEEGGIAANFGEAILRQMVSSGEIIAETFEISSFNSPYLIQRYFGEDFVFKGYPTDSGSGNSLSGFPRLAISSLSVNKQGAWEFLRMILSEQWQRENTPNLSFPTNRIVYEESLVRARQGNENVFWAGVTMHHGQLPNDTSAYVDITLELINSAEGLRLGFDPILDIIFEGLDDLFSGRTDAQNAARIIQNRAAIFIAEQS